MQFLGNGDEVGQLPELHPADATAGVIGEGLGDSMGIEYRLLGRLEVLRDGVPADLGSQRQRALLALMLANAGTVLSTRSPGYAATSEAPAR